MDAHDYFQSSLHLLPVTIQTIVGRLVISLVPYSAEEEYFAFFSYLIVEHVFTFQCIE